MQTTITIRTDTELKEEASVLFESMGLNLSAALNIFMRQAVNDKKFPFVIDASAINVSAADTYPKGFFDLFGSVPDIEFIEPEEAELTEVEL